MPNKDGTGPEGKGPKTGRQMGNCEGAEPLAGIGLSAGQGIGRGARRCAGFGAGFGRGAGRGCGCKCKFKVFCNVFIAILIGSKGFLADLSLRCKFPSRTYKTVV